jgi:CBS domain-containing protein
MTMRIREILNLKGDTIYSIAPGGLLAEAVSLMVKHDVGSLVVLSDGAMVGMVTFREVLAALDAARGSLGRHTVEEVMVKDPVCGKPDDTIDHMRGLMTDLHVRYLPIMEEGRLLGVLSFHDVARAALKAASFENRLLKQYIKNWPEPDQVDDSGVSPPAVDR